MSHDMSFHVPRKVIVGVFPLRQQWQFTALDIPTREKGNDFGSHEEASQWIAKNRDSLDMPDNFSAVEIYQER